MRATSARGHQAGPGVIVDRLDAALEDLGFRSSIDIKRYDVEVRLSHHDADRLARILAAAKSAQ